MVDPPVPRRVLGLLTVGQMSVWGATFLSVFFGPFAVEEVTGSFAPGGLPFAIYYLSNILVVVPAGRLMDRVGRAPVFAMGFGGADLRNLLSAYRYLSRGGKDGPDVEVGGNLL